MRTLHAAIAALSLGVAVPAVAQQPAAAACEPREVSVYFETGSADMTSASSWIAQRIAADAKACGADATIIVDAPQGPLQARRAQSLIQAFAGLGVDVQTAPAARIRAGADKPMADRVATLRLSPSTDAFS